MLITYYYVVPNNRSSSRVGVSFVPQRGNYHAPGLQCNSQPSPARALTPRRALTSRSCRLCLPVAPAAVFQRRPVHHGERRRKRGLRREKADVDQVPGGHPLPALLLRSRQMGRSILLLVRGPLSCYGRRSAKIRCMLLLLQPLVLRIFLLQEEMPASVPLQA